MIQLNHISKVFHQEGRSTTALSDVSLSVPKGRILGVIGESGAGKSTLIRCVNLLERPDTGNVIVDGIDLMKLSPEELTVERRSIGMIFQHFNLLSSRTVSENVAFPLELSKTPAGKIRERVGELLQWVGLENKADDYPSKLSGGQKQRVAIARTLASNPKVLLCDEATSALDPATTHSILSLLKEINKQMGITILLITHEMEVIKDICDEVVVLGEGRLVESGPVAEIFSHPRQELTKRMVSSSLKLHIPLSYEERLSQEQKEGMNKLIRLDISGQSSANAALSDIAKLFQVNSNIVCAQMDHVGGVKFGAMLIELIGAINSIGEAVAYLRSKNIQVEEYGYV